MKRSDAKLNTIDQYVRSLGGRLQVSAVFDNFEAAVTLVQEPELGSKAIHKAGKRSLAHKKEDRAA